MTAIPLASSIARELVAIPTINPPGDEVAAQRHLASLFEARAVELEVFEKEPGRPNLIARMSGRGDRPHLLLHGHIDVVGVDDQHWDHPPFDAVVDRGVLHGRGALDMKSGVAMLTHAFLRACQDGMEPSGDVVLAIVADSETGGGAGLGYLLAEHPDVFDGVGYAIGEFGGFPLYALGEKFYRIGVSQKHYAHLRLLLQGEGGHGSSLDRDTVVGKLGRILADLDRMTFPYHQTPAATATVEAIAAAVRGEKGELLGRLLDDAEFASALVDLGPERHLFEPLFRDTANPTIVRAGSKFNVIPSQAFVEVDARILPGRTVDELIGDIRSGLDDDIEVDLIATGPSSPLEFDDSLMDTLGSILLEMDPSGIPIPFLFNESPDGRLLSDLGIQHYGFLPMDLPPEIDLPALIHGPNERVPLTSVDFGAEAIFRLIDRY